MATLKVDGWRAGRKPRQLATERSTLRHQAAVVYRVPALLHTARADIVASTPNINFRRFHNI